MADQDQKTTTIDDLVKQLSNQGSQKPPFSGSVGSQPPSNLPGIKIESKPLTSSPTPSPVPPVKPPPTPSSQPPSQSLPNLAKPQPFLPPKPAVPPQPLSSPAPKAPGSSATTSTGSAQEYKSSIRTMGEDISSIKSGQKPSGVDIPRKIAPDAMRPPMPGVQKPAVAPSADGPISSIELGRAEKTSPLPFTPTPKGPELPKPPVIQPPIVVPGEKKRFLSPMFYMLIAGILVAGGFMYWFFVLRVSEPKVVVSPTPSPTPTATLLVKSLSEIFEGSPVNFEVSLESISGDFETFVDTLIVAKNEFSRVNLVEDREGTLVPISFLDMFDMALVTYPADLKDNIADLAVLIYGQSESFDKDGSINLNTQNLKQTVFVARINDRVAVKTMMTNWELTIAKDLADYLLIADTSKEANINFVDNTYRGVPIRYKNFPFPDVAVDYSVIDSSGQSYLVISGSREAMYAAIDILLEQ